MGVDSADDWRPVARIQRVRCLGCGVVYMKPADGDTVSAKPGCPDCGYLGWVRDGLTVTPDDVQLRSVENRRPRRLG